MLVGVQAAALSYLIVLALATASLGAAEPAPGTATVDWGAGIAVASRLWLLAFGASLVGDGSEVTLVPWGLTVATAAILVAVARRFGEKSWGSWLVAVGVFAGLLALVAAAVVPGSVPTVTVTAALVAAPSVALGVWRAHGLQLAWRTRVPDWATRGLRRAVGILAGWIMLSASAAMVWALVGRREIADTGTALSPDAVGGVVLAIAQTAWAPTIVLWNLAWFTGQGFSVGEGTLYSPSEVVAGDLPLVPLLAALPSASGGLLVWAPVALVLMAVLVRFATRRNGPLTRGDVAADALAAVVVWAATWAAFAASTGAMGPGRLTQVGPDAAMVALVAAAWAIVGLALVALPIALADLLRARRNMPAEARTALRAGRDGAEQQHSGTGTPSQEAALTGREPQGSSTP
jgi:hypothetical protein